MAGKASCCGGGGGSAGCACALEVVDTASLDLTKTGTGTPADPWVLSGTVTPTPPEAGCGIDVVGNTVSADTAAEFAELTRRSCSDTADGGAATAPLPAGCELNGMPIYCDSAGELRTMPEKFTETALSTLNEAIAGQAPATLPFVNPNPIQIGATNPSSCYCMCGYLHLTFITSISGAPGTVVELNHDYDLGDGLGFRLLSGFTMDNRGKTANSTASFRPTAPLQLCLDPGETKIVRYRVAISRVAGSDNGGVVNISGMAREIRFVGNNL